MDAYKQINQTVLAVVTFNIQCIDQCKVDVDMLNAVKSVLADVLSVSPSSEQRRD